MRPVDLLVVSKLRPRDFRLCRRLIVNGVTKSSSIYINPSASSTTTFSMGNCYSSSCAEGVWSCRISCGCLSECFKPKNILQWACIPFNTLPGILYLGCIGVVVAILSLVGTLLSLLGCGICWGRGSKKTTDTKVKMGKDLSADWEKVSTPAPTAVPVGT